MRLLSLYVLCARNCDDEVSDGPAMPGRRLC
jgi:hypothetical protein